MPEKRVAKSPLLLNEIQRVLAPARCLVCLRAGRWLCLACWSKVLQLAPSTWPCIGCGERPTPRGMTCRSCRKQLILAGVLSAGSYKLPHLQRGVRWLKFKGVRGAAPALARLLLPRLLAIAPWPELRARAVLVPIPLHRRRQVERGFNQSGLLADSLARETGIPAWEALVRQRATWSQSHLPAGLRAVNIRDAFVLAPQPSVYAPSARPLLILVDDVTTSGSTLAAAARPLAEAGWRTIWGLTCARG